MGKTSFVESCINVKRPMDTLPTVGISIATMCFQQQQINLIDCSSFEQYSPSRRMALVQANAAIIVFCDRMTFECLDEWQEEIARSHPFLPVILLGNKDCKLQVPMEEVRKCHPNLRCYFANCQAREECLFVLSKALPENPPRQQVEVAHEQTKKEVQEEDREDRGCCPWFRSKRLKREPKQIES